MHKKYKVLLADDDEDLLVVLRVGLEKAGYQVFTANTGVDAALILDKEPPDIVVSDWQMPSGMGSTLLEYMLSKAELRKIPVVVISGFDNPMIEMEAKGLGANAYIRKPFHHDVLIEEIHRLLRK